MGQAPRFRRRAPAYGWRVQFNIARMDIGFERTHLIHRLRSWCRPDCTGANSCELASKSRWCVSDILARFARSPPHEGEINTCNVRALFSLRVRGRAAEGGRGSFTHHLEFELGNMPKRPRVEVVR